MIHSLSRCLPPILLLQVSVRCGLAATNGSPFCSLCLGLNLLQALLHDANHVFKLWDELQRWSQEREHAQLVQELLLLDLSLLALILLLRLLSALLNLFK